MKCEHEGRNCAVLRWNFCVCGKDEKLLSTIVPRWVINGKERTSATGEVVISSSQHHNNNNNNNTMMRDENVAE